MKRLPESELELMMIIWHAGRPLTRVEIEEQLGAERKIGATTILSFLTRLEEKGFVRVTKAGRNNIYEELISEAEYLKSESGNLFKKLYRGSVRNFMNALYDGDNLKEQDFEELQRFLDEKRKQS